MKLDDFMTIISNLNKGTVIGGIDDYESEIQLGEANLKLYHANQKYYFLSEYHDDYDVLEHTIKSNQFLAEIKDRRPNNSYLILLYKIETFSEEVSKKIIMLEENEFFYKRYVFYYTENEYESFKSWFDKREEKNLTSILQTDDCSPVTKNLYMQFLLRLIIKIPFIKLEFKKMELENFDDLLMAQLNGTKKNKEQIHDLFRKISEELKTYSSEKIADTLFLEIMEANTNEDQVN